MSYIRYRTYDGPYEIGLPESYQVHPVLNTGNGSPLHALFLSVPEKVENPPLIVFIPGGGSTSGGTTHPSPHRTGPASCPNGSRLF